MNYAFRHSFPLQRQKNSDTANQRFENKLLDFPQGKSCEIDSEYDVKRFRFVTDKNVYAFSAALTLFIGQAEERSCDITIPAVFEGDFRVGIIRMVLITNGSSVPAMLAAQATEKLSPSLGVAPGCRPIPYRPEKHAAAHRSAPR